MEQLTRLQKCELAIRKGYAYDHETGFIFGMRGKQIKRKCDGYVVMNVSLNGKEYNLYGHQFAWYYMYKEIVEEIDHKDGIRDNNKILNLRSVTHKQNTFNNTVAKGYCFDKSRDKWLATIKINQIQINLGRFDLEKDARQAYLNAKKIHHIIE